MPPPALAIARIGQQAVDNGFVCIGRTVGEKRVQFRSRGRQSDQVEINSPQQRRFVGLRAGRETGSFESCREERIDGMRGRCAAGIAGKRRTQGRFESPVLSRVSFRRLVRSGLRSCSIQRRMRSASSGAKGSPSGGMRVAASGAVIRSISGLSSGRPATIAGPPSPPCRIIAAVSSLKLPSCLSPMAGETTLFEDRLDVSQIFRAFCRRHVLRLERSGCDGGRRKSREELETPQ